MKTEQRTEIYFKRKDSYNREVQTQQAWTGSQANKQLIKEFSTHLFAKGTGKLRVSKLMWELRKICDAINKDLNKTTSKDIENYLSILNQTDYSELTKSDYRRAIKSFYLWFEDEDARLSSDIKQEREDALKLYKYVNKYVKSTYKKRSLDYSTIITEKDLNILINKGCKSIMEKAFISVLHETGCRVGEILNIRIRDIEHKEKHSIIRLDGKTGERRVPILQSVSWLIRYLEEHPDNENPNSLLWISKNARYRDQPLRYYGVVRLLERVFERAKVKKKNNPHWFRHSRATIIAPYYSEAILCKIMGWSLGSRQAQTYVHLGAKQVEEEFKKKNGLAKIEETETKVTYCSCGANNSKEARYCYKCGRALSMAVYIEDEQKKNDAINEALELFANIMSNPELKTRFEEFKKKGGMKNV